jgi:hypothetical protein
VSRLRVALLGLVIAGCITPSIPIPPPEPTAMTFGVDPQGGLATFSYRAMDRFSGAIVYVYNQDLGVGVIATANADGSVDETQPFAAAAGDQILVTFQLGDDAASTCVRLRDGTPNEPCI